MQGAHGDACAAVELGIVPTRPPNPYASQDERDAYALAAALGLDAAGYKQVAVKTRRLVELPRYRRLRAAIERAALEHGSLDQAAIERIVEASAARPRPERNAMAARLDDLEHRVRQEERRVVRDLARAKIARIKADWQDEEAAQVAIDHGLADW